jgi:two-component system response regulator AlgR
VKEPLRAFLLDDEAPALRRLEIALAGIADVEVIGSSQSARGAIQAIRALRPDLLFLDISMPGMSGFDVVNSMEPEYAPAVVFVTAFDEHAVRAFGVDAVDYLLKPVAPERLLKAVQRARDAKEADALRRSARPASGSAFTSELWASRNRGQVRIAIADVDWIEAERDYLRLHTADGDALLRMTLSAIQSQLDPEQFVRVHRSAICRRDAIVALRRGPTGAVTISLRSGDEVPVGRIYLRALRASVASRPDPAGRHAL